MPFSGHKNISENEKGQTLFSYLGQITEMSRRKKQCPATRRTEKGLPRAWRRRSRGLQVQRLRGFAAPTIARSIQGRTGWSRPANKNVQMASSCLWWKGSSFWNRPNGQYRITSAKAKCSTLKCHLNFDVQKAHSITGILIFGKFVFGS